MSGPRRLGTLLGGWNARGSARAEMTADARAAAIASAWEQAVGPEIARRSRPAKLSGGVLTVLTASSAWSSELTFLAPKIIEALRRAVPEADLRRLRFSVASGRTRLLLEGARHAGPSRAGARSSDGHEAAKARTSSRGEEGPAATIERLAAAQRSLDEWRDQAGWSACATCGKRFAPAAGNARECAPCAAARRRREEARIERVLMEAPWLTLAQVRESLPETRAAAYRRTRQRLATRWQNELFAAERRLRRAALTVHDRVAAWSFLMLQTGMPERDIGRAVAHDALGPTWTNALFTRSESGAEEARAQARENFS
jgi:predicted nucleic acid-binding Zn ribbon protein